jgi:hypothetical protein
MIFSILILDRKLVRHSVTNAIKTLPESHGARDRERSLEKLTSVRRFQQQERGPYQVDGPLPAAQATSKRSWSITLVHAATKSFANFSFESAHA